MLSLGKEEMEGPPSLHRPLSPSPVLSLGKEAIKEFKAFKAFKAFKDFKDFKAFKAFKDLGA